MTIARPCASSARGTGYEHRLVPERAFEEHFTDFKGLRQLVVRPYRVVYEATNTACNILGVLRCSRLIGSTTLN